MRVFLTGASGFIGSAIVPELLKAGHQVLGLARSDSSAQAIEKAGAQAIRGDLEDLESLRKGAAASDAVIHTAFIHDFSRFQAVCDVDKLAIETLGSVLEGSDRPLIVSSGTGLLRPGQLALEEYESDSPFPRVASEKATIALAKRGVRTALVRLPQVHDTVKQGLITYLIALAREKGVSAYVGEGLNRWPAAHRDDVAYLYKLVLEKGTAGGRYHAVDEEGVALRDIAKAIGRYLKVPVVSKTPQEAADHFGWLAYFVSGDIPASSQQTRESLGWKPTGPDLITDLNNMK